MDLKVNMRTIAHGAIHGPYLLRRVGSYELQLEVDFRIASAVQAEGRSAVLTGAELRARGQAGGMQTVGFARFDIPMRIVPLEHSIPVQKPLHLALLPTQVEAIEELRAAGDLDFELIPAGEGFFGENSHPIVEEWRQHVARSDWTEQLRNAGALDVLLLEVPMKFGAVSPEQQTARNDMLSAQRHFLSGEYLACISSCRRVLDALGNHAYGPGLWTQDVWANLKDREKREAMSKDERETAVITLVRHYTHLANHPESDGGTSMFSRSEAKLTLALTAAIATRIWGR